MTVKKQKKENLIRMMANESLLSQSTPAVQYKEQDSLSGVESFIRQDEDALSAQTCLLLLMLICIYSSVSEKISLI